MNKAKPGSSVVVRSRGGDLQRRGRRSVVMATRQVRRWRHAMYATYSSFIAFDQLPAPTNTIELVNKLGEGTYGSVHLAIDKRSGTMR